MCDEQSEKGCLRCGVPLCHKHRPKRGHRCNRCEGNYKEEVNRLGLTISERGRLLSFKAYKPMIIALPIGILSGVLISVVSSTSIAVFPLMLLCQISLYAAMAFFLLWIAQLSYQAVTGVDSAIDRRRLKLFRKNFLKERPKKT